METLNYEEIINQILKNEDLMPGDKVSYDRLIEISNKYKIAPYTLATNVFGATQPAYTGLISKASNAKNIIILKQRIPQMIEDAVKLRKKILEQENLNIGSKINYERISRISIKYGIRERYLAIYVFDISQSSYRKIKSDKNTNAIILNKNRLKKQYSEDKEIQEIREKILRTESLKVGDKINYQRLLNISKKYDILPKKLAMDVFGLTLSSYNHIKCDPKRNAIILKGYFSKDKLDNIKKCIIEKEQLKPYDEVNYEMLLEISKRNNINDRVLAIDILGLTENQYHNIRYNSKSVAYILKRYYENKTLEELRAIKNLIFENEKFYEGYSISFSEIENLKDKYHLPIKELLYVLGITYQAYYWIKRNQQYNSIVKDTEVLLITQILSERLEKNRYYSNVEIEQLCEENNITLQNFYDYVLGKAKYFERDDYSKVLNKKGKIWIGDRHSVSDKFSSQKIYIIQDIARRVSNYIYYNHNSKDRKLEKDDLYQESCLYILTQCGDLEKNFDDDDLEKMIYLRTRINMLKLINMNSKIKTISTTKYFQKSKDRSAKGDKRNSDLDLKDSNGENPFRNIEQNEDTENVENSIIEYLSKLLEQGYDRSTALNKTADVLGVDKETMLEAMKQELIRRRKVKKTNNDEYILTEH